MPTQSTLANGADSNFWYAAPSSPSVFDDEFESTTLDAKWSTALVAGTISPYVASGGTSRYALHTNYRPSWLCAQPNAGSFRSVVQAGITTPTNFLIVSRCRVMHHAGTVNTSDSQVGINLRESGSSEGLNVYLNRQTGGTLKALFEYRQSSTNNTIGQGAVYDQQGMSIEYIALHKIGSDYTGYFGTTNNTWYSMGTHTWTGGSLVDLGLRADNAVAVLNSFGEAILGWDFIRCYETAEFPF